MCQLWPIYKWNWKLKKPNLQVQLDYSQMHKNNIIKMLYAVTVKSQFKELQQDGKTASWEKIRTILVESAEKHYLGRKDKQKV